MSICMRFIILVLQNFYSLSILFYSPNHITFSSVYSTHAIFIYYFYQNVCEKMTEMVIRLVLWYTFYNVWWVVLLLISYCLANNHKWYHKHLTLNCDHCIVVLNRIIVVSGIVRYTNKLLASKKSFNWC